MFKGKERARLTLPKLLGDLGNRGGPKLAKLLMQRTDKTKFIRLLQNVAPRYQIIPLTWL